MAACVIPRSHHTDVSNRPWNSAAVERRVPDNPRAFRKVYACVNRNNPANKTDAKFPHHEVTADGRPGPANVRALTNGIAILNGGRGGAAIDAADRKAIYRHLATHMRDAGREPAPLKDRPSRAGRSRSRRAA